MEINVIDSLPGTGKTSWAIQMMNEHPEKLFCYCTPFLEEVQRIKEACPSLQFKEPTYEDGRKLDNFNFLLSSGDNIVTTHKTFTNATEETMEYIAGGEYTLILDEAIDVVASYNSVIDDPLNPNDIRALFDKGFVKCDDLCKLVWQADDYPDFKYYSVEKMCKSNELYCINNQYIMWELPPKIFQCFKEVYIMTYLFEGGIMDTYFFMYNMSYKKLTVQKDDNGQYQLIEWDKTYENERRKKYGELITVYKDREMNNYRNYSLSKSWFSSESNKEAVALLKKHVERYFRHYRALKSSDIMWTTIKSYREALSGKGYTCIKRVSKKRRDQMSGKELAEVECFVPLSAKSINYYNDRHMLAYAYNFYVNPNIKQYFNKRSALLGRQTQIDNNQVALSALLQWMFRSAIRNDEPITIYIPSERMRNLLQAWLSGEM